MSADQGMKRGVGYPQQTIAQVFCNQACATPDAVALRFRGADISYHALDRASDGVAHLLLDQSLPKGAIVAIAMARTPKFIACLLGILKAGMAYMPVDADWPKARLHTVLGDASASLLLTDTPFDSVNIGDIKRLELKTAFENLAGDRSGAVQVRIEEGTPQNPAYVNFTSGSSGAPKGVVVPHRGIVSLLFPASYTNLSAETVTLLHSPATFDGLTFELWAPLLHGGTCVLFEGVFPSPGRVRAAIRENGVTILLITSAVFNLIVDSAPDTLAPLQAVMTGGEALSASHVRRAQALYPDLAVTNVYGPTESTTFATAFPVSDLLPDAVTVPIGRAISNREVFVARPDMTPTPVGEVGEICIAGPGLALGYVGQAELTAERFVQSGGEAEPRVVYRTGDLGRCGADGMIEFLGRVDFQVKLNGYRIELEEIERTLLANEIVQQATVIVHGVGIERALKAAVVAPLGTAADLKAYLVQTLPAYMIPANIRLVDGLPLKRNGKVDRLAVAGMFDPVEVGNPKTSAA